MNAHIITIGDEILIGQIIDTNSAFISKELIKIGIEVTKIVSIGDSKKAILSSLKDSQNNCDIAIITGGFGPTNDDITKDSFCEFFDDELVRKNPLNHLCILKHMSSHFHLKHNLSTAVPSKLTYLPICVYCQCFYKKIY